MAAEGFQLGCPGCHASGNPRGCRAFGHYVPTPAEDALSYLAATAERLRRERSPRAICPVCGSELCAERRAIGRPLLCD